MVTGWLLSTSQYWTGLALAASKTPAPTHTQRRRPRKNTPESFGGPPGAHVDELCRSLLSFPYEPSSVPMAEKHVSAGSPCVFLPALMLQQTLEVSK